MQHRKLRIIGGIFRVERPIVSPGPIEIAGENGGSGIYANACHSGLRSGTANIDLLTLLGAGSAVRNLCIDSVGTSNTFGSAIVVPGGANSTKIESNQLYGVCWAIDLSGSGTAQNVATIIDGNVIRPAARSTCGGIRLGAKSVHGNTVDAKITSNQIYCNTGRGTGLLILDSGGLMATNNVFAYGCGHGTKIFPGFNQQVLWSSFVGSVLGDSDTGSGLLIDSNASNAVIFGQRMVGTWAANSQSAPAILIQNSADSPNISGIYMEQPTIYMGPNQHGIVISGGKNIRIQGGAICASARSTATGIVIRGNASDIAIQNNRIGACDHFRGTLATGISVSTSASDIGTIVGNNLSNAKTPILWRPTSSADLLSVNIANNLGIDDSNFPELAAANTIHLPMHPIVVIFGQATIETMNTAWPGRQVRLISMSPSLLRIGGSVGNICNSLTIRQFESATAVFSRKHRCWFLK